MIFIDTKRFSPVSKGKDLPNENDLFHRDYQSLSSMNQKQHIQYCIDNSIVIDEKWWKKQIYRCLNGYTVENAIDKGGDFLVDGIDALWTGDDCYLSDYDLWIKNKTVHISGFYYFFLNFWKMRGAEVGDERKTLINPQFAVHQFLFSRIIEMMYEQEKDDQETKSRQLGFSEMLAALVAYYYHFFPMSQNIIVAGEQTDADNTFFNVDRGIDALCNTQFNLRKARGFDNKQHLKTLNGSEILTENANDDPEALSRYSPTLVIYEEIGKGKKGWSLKVAENVHPSLYVLGRKTGYQIYIGCVCAGTKIFTNNGELKNIEDIKQEDGIIGYNTHGIHKNKITYIQNEVYKPCYRITTKCGIVLECSEDHPILWSKLSLLYTKRNYIKGKRIIISSTKRAEWKETKDIKKGDQIAFAECIGLFGEQEMFSPRLIGMLIGDGTYGYDHSPRLSNCDIEINSYVESNFNANIKLQKQTKDGRTYKEILIKDICGELRRLGIYGQTKDKKRLPKNLHLYTKESIQELIAGLFDTDGCIYVNNQNNLIINITQLSKELLEELRFLLFRFGIFSNINKIKIYERKEERKIKDKNEYYILSISGYESIMRFRDNFKLLIKYKQDVLENAKNYIKKKGISDYWVKVEYDKHNKTTNLIGMKAMRFDQVKSVEYIGEKRVYNLTAETTNTYLANGIITHNTGGNMDKGVTDLQTRTYNPSQHNCLSFTNKWKKENDTGNVKVTHFNPAYIYKIVDEDGNPKVKESIEYILKERESKSPQQKYIHVSHQAIYLEDVFQATTGGYFGPERARLLMQRYNYILTHREAQITRKGHLEWKNMRDMNSGVRFVDATEEELMKEEWYCEIVEEPETTPNGDVYANLNVAGTDTYNQDEAETSDSLGSFTVYKKWRNESDSPFFNTWVMLILERPGVGTGGQERFYEHVLMGCVYYNVLNNIEYVNPHIFDYFDKKNAYKYLMERPSLAFAGQIKDQRSSNRYGTDKSLKPHVLSNLRDKMDEDQINRLWIPRQILAFAKFKYTPGDKYNCDITIAAGESLIAYKETESLSIIDMKAKIVEPQPIWREINGILQRIAV